MQILDTQIISYAIKGTYDGQVAHQSIASITANEFLLVQGAEQTKANYYVPLPQIIGFPTDHKIDFPRRDHPFTKHRTDQIILEFGQDYPAIIEFGNLAITETINSKAKGLFNESIRFLDKEKRKLIFARFNFLLSQNINCLPLSRNTVVLGLDLFCEFLSRYNTKENFRNTVNDVFILATAVNASATLVTKDSLLNRFASDYYNGLLKEKSGFLSIDFGKEKNLVRRRNRESKGYINKGWRIRVRNYRNYKSAL